MFAKMRKYVKLNYLLSIIRSQIKDRARTFIRERELH